LQTTFLGEKEELEKNLMLLDPSGRSRQKILRGVSCSRKDPCAQWEKRRKTSRQGGVGDGDAVKLLDEIFFNGEGGGS